MTDQIDDGYVVQLPGFAPDPWPEYNDVVTLAEYVALGHGTWPEAIATFKATHHLDEGKWMPNA